MNEITVLMPIHNRSIYFKSILKYYDELEVKFKFLITDDSDPEEKLKNKEAIEQYSRLNIEYFDIENPPENPYFSNINFLLQKVKTKYILPSSDDDFFNPTALMSGVDLLNREKNISVIQGPIRKITFGHQTKKIYSDFIYGTPALDDADIKKRVLKASQYNIILQSINGMMRTENAQKNFQFMYESNLFADKQAYFPEVFWHAINAIQGRIINVGLPFWLRLAIRNDERLREMNSHPRGSTWTHRGAMYFCNVYNSTEKLECLRKVIEKWTSEIESHGVDPKESYRLADSLWVGMMFKRFVESYEAIHEGSFGFKKRQNPDENSFTLVKKVKKFFQNEKSEENVKTRNEELIKYEFNQWVEKVNLDLGLNK